MAGALANVTGTGLRPGVSRNRRWYPSELIGRAVERAAARLADPDGRPITMRVAHPHPDEAAWAPVTEIVGALTEVKQEADGSMSFAAALSGNTAGADVLKLIDTRGTARPFLRNVSIRGRWLGDVRTVLVEGQPCETADDLEIDGIDFTHMPGVDGARIERVSGPGSTTEAADRQAAYITESCEGALVTAIQETADAATSTTPATTTATTEAEGVVYADLGYLAGGGKRYPLGSRAQVRAAWHAIGEAEIARQYTSAQLKRVRGRIRTAAGRHGVTITQEGWTVVTDPLSESQVAEMWCADDTASRPSFSVDVDNGSVCVRVYSYRVDAHDLDRVARAAMDGAVSCLASLDPDMDGDIDVRATEASAKPPVSGEDDECETVATEAAATEQTPASSADAATTTESEGSAMAETTNQAADATAAAAPIALTQESLAALVSQAAASAASTVVEAMEAKRAAKKAARVAAATEAASTAAPVAEAAPAAAVEPAAAAPAAAPAVTESDDQRIARLVQEGITRALQGNVAAGTIVPARKGLVGKVSESGTVQQLGESGDELNAHGLPKSWAGESAAHELKGSQRGHLSAAVMQHVIGNRI
jgi:hypothetical protein